MANTVKELYTPALKSFIPMIYVAWADGLLSPSEAKIIREKIQSLPQLNVEEKQQLLEWIDPSQWPDENTFKSWMALMKDVGSDTHPDETQSIVDLGLAMARRGNTSIAQSDLAAITEALTDLQKQINFAPPAKFRALQTDPLEKPPENILDINLLQRIIDGDNYEDKLRIKKLLSDPVFDRKIIRDKEQYRLKILHWLKLLAAHGYGALGYPTEYGGQGNIIKYASVFEVLSHFDLSLAVKFGVQFGLFGGSVQHLGTKKHHDKYLTAIGNGELLGCFAMTETGHGSNVRDLETTATYDADTHQLVVHTPHNAAGKEYIGNALHARVASVFAQLIVQGSNQGVHAILVPLRDENNELLSGIRVEDNGYKMGLNGVDNGRIWFDHVKVPRENLLNRFGNITLLGRYESEIPNPSKRFFTMLGTLVAGRICVAKGALSAAKSALVIAVKYAIKRRQFGPDHAKQEMLIMDYPSHQRRLLPRLARALAADFALQDLVTRYQHTSTDDLRIIETQAAGIKAYTTWFANETIQECREACGGKGYLSENGLADLRADADIFATFEGDNTVLMQLVAKGLLSSFKQEFNDAGFMGAIRYLANQVSDSFLSINPVYKRKTDVDHLLDPGFHRHAFQFRQRKLLYSLGSRMREMFKKRITPYDVFLRSQTHMIELAKAYVEMIILEQFQNRLNQIDNSLEKDTLTTLYQLFALETIEQNKGWYLEQDYLEYVKTKAIRHTVDRLCSQVRDQCHLIVDGFGIPDHLLGAEIV
ncbi:MAG: acyl-CoA dehydrogenase family protein [Saprospiraceae bacterium]|nr:acyl-CoA dehydrogenase family protein [Saprospiraceae bacterium]